MPIYPQEKEWRKNWYDNKKTRIKRKGNGTCAILAADCKNTGVIQQKLKRLFAGTIEQMLDTNLRLKYR